MGKLTEKIKTDYSLWIRTDGELSDMAMDWALEAQDDMPVDVDPKAYYLDKVKDKPEGLTQLLFELWQAADNILIEGLQHVIPSG